MTTGCPTWRIRTRSFPELYSLGGRARQRVGTNQSRQPSWTHIGPFNDSVNFYNSTTGAVWFGMHDGSQWAEYWGAGKNRGRRREISLAIAGSGQCPLPAIRVFPAIPDTIPWSVRYRNPAEPGSPAGCRLVDR